MNENSRNGFSSDSAKKSLRLNSLDEGPDRDENVNATDYLFKYLIFCNICLYLETGAVPALLIPLARMFEMGKATQGLLGGIVYLALAVGGPLAGVCLSHFQAKTVLCISLLACNTFCLLLACSPSGVPHAAAIFITARALVGICQCFFCIFVPIWTDEFAPPTKRARWMGCMQGSTPISVMCGYLLASISLWIDDKYDTAGFFFEAWRWPFLIQFISLLPFCGCIFLVPAAHLHVNRDLHNQEDPSAHKEQPTVLEMVRTHFIGQGWTSFSTSSSENIRSVRLSGQRHNISPRSQRRVSIGTLQSSFVLPLRAKDSLIQSFNWDDIEVNRHADSLKSGKDLFEHQLGSPDFLGGVSYQQNGQIEAPLQQEKNEYFIARILESQRTKKMEEILVSSPSIRCEDEESWKDHFVDSVSDPDISRKFSFSKAQVNPASSRFLVQYTSGKMHIKQVEDPNSSRDERKQNFRTSSPKAYETAVLELNQQDISNISSTLHLFGTAPSQQPSLWQELCSLASNPVYVAMVMAISALYFVVTGIQFWGTSYLLLSLGGSRMTVNIMFMVTAASAPTLGVFFGATIIDHIGGYKGARQQIKTLQVILCFGSIAVGFAIPTTFFTNLYKVVVLLWLVLFFGASALPSVTGIIISVVGRHQRELASSLALVLFNLLGYSLCPILSGFIMQYLGDHYRNCDARCQNLSGMRFVLCWSVWAVIAIGAALFFSIKQKQCQYLPTWNQDFEVVSPFPQVLKEEYPSSEMLSI